MRITIVMGPFLCLPPGHGGAVERRWDGVAKLFARRGHQVTMLSKSPDGSASRFVVDDVVHIRKRGFKQTENLRINLFKDLIYSIGSLFSLPKSDIVITNVFWLPFLMGFFRNRWGKVVVNVARYPKGQIRLYLRSARIVVPSNAVKEAVCQQCPRAESLTKVVPNPVNLEIFGTPRPPRTAERIKSIVYTGRVHPEKGLHLLIEAFAILCDRVADIRLRIIGPVEIDHGGGGEQYIAKLRSLAGNLPVEFVAPIGDPHELSAVLHSADYFCYPSMADKGESFGVAPLEAMATGLAPVVSGLKCFQDFVEDGRTGYTFDHRGPNAVMDLAEALYKLISNTARTREMGQRASRSAQAFSYDCVADRYLKDFQLLLDDGEPL